MTKQIEYIDTGVPYCPKIPNTWGFKKLKYVVTINDEVLSETTDKETEINYVEISDVNYLDGLKNYTPYLFKEAPSRARRIVMEGDILVSTVRTYLKAITRVTKTIENLIASTGFAVLRPRFINSAYLGHYVLSQNFIDETIANSVGISYPAINSSEIGEFKIPIPPIKEQEIIANFLDQKTAEIDNLISKKQKLIECLKEERLVQIRLLITKGIEKKQFKNSGIDWIGEIPNEWEVKKLKYVSRKVQTGSTPPTSMDEYYGDEFNWYTSADFSDNLLLENSSRKISFLAVQDEVVRVFPENSVLIVGIGATLGKVGYITSPASSNQQINAIVFSSIEEAKFYANLFYAFKDVVLSKSNASTLAILNQAQTKDFIVPVPKEQELPFIVSEIEELNTRIENTIRKIETEIELIKEYRTSLINEVVTGKKLV